MQITINQRKDSVMILDNVCRSFVHTCLKNGVKTEKDMSMLALETATKLLAGKMVVAGYKAAKVRAGRAKKYCKYVSNY